MVWVGRVAAAAGCLGSGGPFRRRGRRCGGGGGREGPTACFVLQRCRKLKKRSWVPGVHVEHGRRSVVLLPCCPTARGGRSGSGGRRDVTAAAVGRSALDGPSRWPWRSDERPRCPTVRAVAVVSVERVAEAEGSQQLSRE